MSTISNKFFVTALEDGTTLHGNLRATMSLTQAYNDGVCVPDWTQSANQPTIYLSLMNGVNYITPDANYTWEYNGSTIVWQSSSATSVSADGLFQKVQYTPTGYPTGTYVPAIKIIGNLASSTNVDIDVITFKGAKTISTAPISFSSSINVRITEWIRGGYLGTLSFVDGIADISRDNDTVIVYGTLYNDASTVTGNDLGLAWYLNDTLITSEDITDDCYVDASKRLVVKEGAVVDYATVKCVFSYRDTEVYTAYVGIDDTQDPEYMYIQYAGQNGNAASLRAGDSVTFSIWVGTADDATVNTSWTTFKVKFLDAYGVVITESLTSYSATIADADSDGYRLMTTSQGVATITIPYALANDKGKAITGLILASQS